jgi:hypothetical protein
MMEGQLAVNTKHTGDPKKDHRGYAEPFTSEQVDALLSEEWLKQMVADIRSGQEEKKDDLPYACPHYERFRNNHRAQADIIPEAFTFMTCVDVDDKKLVKKAIKRSLELNDEEGDWQGMVLRIDFSARKKVHIWLRMPVGKTISETQKLFCDEIDVPYDESCCTPERFIYLTGIDEEVYRSENWLKPLSDEEIEERREAFLNRGLDVDGRPLKKEAGRTQGTGTSVTSQATSQMSQSPCATEVIEANERTRYVFMECMKEEDVTEADLVNEGGRHNSVKVVLSHCNQLLSEGETLGVLKELMPNNWNDENIRTLVKAYYTDYYNPSQRLSVFQKRVFRESKRMGLDRAQGTGTTVPCIQSTDGSQSPCAAPTMDAPLSEIYASAMPPKMPEQQPKLIKLLTSNTPEIYKATVAHAVFPSLGAHLHQVQFRYTDNVLHEATLMNVAMAVTGGGKGCIDEPINHIMADIRERDAENERRLKEYNEANNRKGANKDKLERPDDLVIQEIQADVTHAGFVQRLDEAQKRFLYFKLNEIEMFDQLKSKPGQQFVIICQSFDPGNRYGQTRAGSQSVNATVSIRFNWNSSGTIVAVQQYFSKVLTKGPISRINFCTIPEREIGAEQPVYGIYNEKFDEQLQPYIKNLTNASGIIVCKQAKQLALKLIAECAEFSRLSQDRVFENLSFRANVIAYLKACVLYVANGCKWEKSIEDFIRWSLHYDLWCKMRFFADGIRRAEYAAKGNIRGPRNLLALLPDEFTYQDAVNLRLKEGKTAEGTSNMLAQWVFRQYILRITDYSFKKLMYKRNEQG